MIENTDSKSLQICTTSKFIRLFKLASARRPSSLPYSEIYAQGQAGGRRVVGS